MYVGDYAERDAEVTYQLWKKLKQELSNQDLESIFELRVRFISLSSRYEI